MLLAFIVIQLAINIALLAGLFRLLKQREAISGEARRREEQLAVFAAELCALGRDMARRDTTVAGSPPVSDSAGGTVLENGTAPAPHPVKTTAAPGASDRPEGTARSVRQDVGLDRVAAERAFLEGELQVLRNLARGTRSKATVHPVARAATAVEGEATDEERRRVRGAPLGNRRLGVSAEFAPAVSARARDA